jgi:hypothetical protein
MDVSLETPMPRGNDPKVQRLPQKWQAEKGNKAESDASREKQRKPQSDQRSKGDRTRKPDDDWT